MDLSWSVYCKSNMATWGWRLLTYFPIFVPVLKNDKIPKFLCLLRGGGWGLTYSPTFVLELKNDTFPTSGGGGGCLVMYRDHLEPQSGAPHSFLAVGESLQNTPPSICLNGSNKNSTERK